MSTVAEISKSDVGSWETVASFVATFPSDNGEGACDVDVQIGEAPITADADEDGNCPECGHPADGSSGHGSCDHPSHPGSTVWFIRTRDDAGGDDDADDTQYATEDVAREAAEAYASEHDEGNGEDAESHLRAADEATAGEPDADGEWCMYWETALDDAGPRTRYATEEQAQAAAKIANIDLRAANPGGNLLCGFSVRSLVDGDWVESEVQS